MRRSVIRIRLEHFPERRRRQLEPSAPEGDIMARSEFEIEFDFLCWKLRCRQRSIRVRDGELELCFGAVQRPCER